MPISLLSRLIGKREDPRAAIRPLWNRIVEVAREKQWYADHGVADSVGGRFDMITLVLALVMLRMERDNSLIEPSARLTELFVSDMDGQLRQSGIGDLVVGKHVGKLMSVLGGRIDALRQALPLGNSALTEFLERNVTLTDGANARDLAGPVTALACGIAALTADDLLNARMER